VSAHPIVSGESESCPNDTLCLDPGLPVGVTSRAAPAAPRSEERLLGALGLMVSSAILALGVYFGLKYLL